MNQWIKDVAWVSETKNPVRGVILAFHGLGAPAVREGPANAQELAYIAAGGLVVFPYYGPWSWMNRQARAFVDELVGTIYAEYTLADSVPLISTGGSMGGCSALLYTRYARKPVAACSASCPVCDVPYHVTERVDLPRTFRNAFYGYEEPFETVLQEHSPLAQASHMPDVPYLVVHGDADTAVNKEKHSDRFVAAMKAHKRRVEYVEVPGMGHGGPLPLAVIQKEIEFVVSHMKRCPRSD
ncbi:MAG: prolyl oligopeptidase family serine peptidase [Planctomycetota bacterium]|nr:prolyl oligopeptidase family serine peptidase [Planctomycetota bacterium]